MTKPTTKEKLIENEWKEDAKSLAKQGSMLVLHGMLFGFGGIIASNISGRISARNTQRAINNSDNVIEFDKVSNA
jgi:coproporphyrinogen III oxidase